MGATCGREGKALCTDLTPIKRARLSVMCASVARCNMEEMNHHPVEFSTARQPWHHSRTLFVPDDSGLVCLPLEMPDPKPTEQVWSCPKSNHLL